MGDSKTLAQELMNMMSESDRSSSVHIVSNPVHQPMPVSKQKAVP